MLAKSAALSTRPAGAAGQPAPVASTLAATAAAPAPASTATTGTTGATGSNSNANFNPSSLVSVITTKRSIDNMRQDTKAILGAGGASIAFFSVIFIMLVVVAFLKMRHEPHHNFATSGSAGGQDLAQRFQRAKEATARAISSGSRYVQSKSDATLRNALFGVFLASSLVGITLGGITVGYAVKAKGEGNRLVQKPLAPLLSAMTTGMKK